MENEKIQALTSSGGNDLNRGGTKTEVVSWAESAILETRSAALWT